MLIIIFGQIGTGKTSLAKEITRKLNYELIYFDREMWEVFDKEEMYSDDDEFLLNEDEIPKVYEAMHNKAKKLLKQGKNVVLESMYFKKQREIAIKIVKDYRLIEVVCDEEIIKERLEKRRKENKQNPGFKLYLKYRDSFEKEDSEHIVIDTTNKTVEESAEEVIKKI